MKKFYTTLLIAILSLGLAFGQQVNLAFGSKGVIGIPDSVTFGQKLDVSFYLVNMGPDTINQEVLIRYAVDTVDFPSEYEIVASSGPVANWLPGDSMYFAFEDTVDRPAFVAGDNVTIVWPTTIISSPGNIEFYNEDVIVSDIQAIGINELDFEVNIFPNPSSDRINIGTEESISWTLYNMNGQVIKQGTEKQFSITDLPKGYYHLEILRSKDQTRGAYRIMRK